MEKNEYFDAYFLACQNLLTEREYKINKFACIGYFQNHWKTKIETLSAKNFAKEFIISVGLVPTEGDPVLFTKLKPKLKTKTKSKK